MPEVPPEFDGPRLEIRRGKEVIVLALMDSEGNYLDGERAKKLALEALGTDFTGSITVLG